MENVKLYVIKFATGFSANNNTPSTPVKNYVLQVLYFDIYWMPCNLFEDKICEPAGVFQGHNDENNM